MAAVEAVAGEPCQSALALKLLPEAHRQALLAIVALRDDQAAGDLPGFLTFEHYRDTIDVRVGASIATGFVGWTGPSGPNWCAWTDDDARTSSSLGWRGSARDAVGLLLKKWGLS